MSAYKQKPILEAFKSAGRLANEWRDTLFYTSLLGAGIANQVLEWGPSPEVFFAAAAIRENIRYHNWKDGVATNASHFRACSFFFNAATMGYLLAPPSSLGGASLFSIWFMLDLTLAKKVGLTPKVAYKLYEDLLFDYPRKVLPPQDREGHKLKVKAQDFWAGIKGKLKNLAPAPEPKAVLAPVRMAQNATKTAEAHIPA